MNAHTSVRENVPNVRDLEHPWLFYILMFGVLLFATGFVVNLLGRPTWAGFLAIYAVIAFIASGFGYVLIALFRISAAWQA